MLYILWFSDQFRGSPGQQQPSDIGNLSHLSCRCRIVGIQGAALIVPGRRPGFRLQEGPSKFDVPRYMSTSMNIYMIITKGLAPCEFRLASGTRDTPSNLITCLV